jgi:hypothetical protein
MVLVVGIAASPLWAAGGATREKGNASKKDPVADAFALPRGFALRADQQEPYNRLKSEMEPRLRDALSQVEAATGGEKDRAAKNVMAVRKEIKARLVRILQQPDPVAIKRAQDAAKAAQKARQQQQKKKRR